MKLRIKTGDTVRIIAGDHKGTEGKIVRVLRDKNKAIVEGANMVSKHEKPSAKNPQGGIVKKEAPIHLSNLALIDSKSGETTKVRYEERDGAKVRVAKKSNEVI
ncbi:MAG: 50S ribosomal protein L24 [Flavobacteriaceae bacterium]